MDEQRGDEHGIRDRLSTAGEDALGELAHNLLENPLFGQAVAAALGAGERALQAQRSAMTALNIPATSDLERLERRVRSLSDRLEELEDRIDDVADDLAAMTRRLSQRDEPAARDQSRLSVPDPGDGS